MARMVATAKGYLAPTGEAMARLINVGEEFNYEGEESTWFHEVGKHPTKVLNLNQRISDLATKKPGVDIQNAVDERVSAFRVQAAADMDKMRQDLKAHWAKQIDDLKAQLAAKDNEIAVLKKKLS